MNFKCNWKLRVSSVCPNSMWQLSKEISFNKLVVINGSNARLSANILMAHISILWEQKGFAKIPDNQP